MPILPPLRALPFVLSGFFAGCSGEPTLPDPADTLMDAPLSVRTDRGPIEGAALGATRAFLGIPFAEPPVAGLRWKPPVPHAPWTEKRMATEKGPSCTQSNPLTQKLDITSQEDCLTLNVWTPARLKASAPVPVLVWIHGGAFTLGSGGEDGYDGRLLSEASGAIVVTVNYRLGPFGFLALPELKSEVAGHPSSGFYGIEDQRLAMQWVKDNIAAFGGDPQRVTLFGESAGGISTCVHLLSPKSQGLFQRAIIESGPCDTVGTESAAFKQGAAFVDALGCKTAADPLACVRGKSTAQVMSALPQSGDFLFGKGASWFPIVEGWNLPDRPSKLLSAGSFQHMPTILGANADEATLFFALPSTMVADEAAFTALAESLVPGRGKDVVARYPLATYGSWQKAAMAAVGHGGFVCPTRRMARAFATAGSETYLYHFTYAPKGSLFGELGAFHSAELKYVFGNPSQILPQRLTDEEQQLSATVMGYFSRHAATGDPNGAGAPAWPRYRTATDENLVLDLKPMTQSGLKNDLCDFWDSVSITTP